MKRIISALCFTIFIFGGAGWIYIANNAVHHPETLPLPLTHVAPFPREDIFGMICFALSFIALFVYRYLNHEKPTLIG